METGQQLCLVPRHTTGIYQLLGAGAVARHLQGQVVATLGSRCAAGGGEVPAVLQAHFHLRELLSKALGERREFMRLVHDLLQGARAGAAPAGQCKGENQQ